MRTAAFTLIVLVATLAHAGDLNADSKTLVKAKAAAPNPKLLVVGLAVDPAAQAAVSALEQAVEAVAARRFSVLRGVDAADPSGAERRAAQLAEAEALVKQGKKAFDELDAEGTLKFFGQALEAYRGSDASLSFAGAIEARLLKAAALVALDKGSEARLELDRVLALSPKATLSDALFPPEFLKYAEGQRRVVANARGELKVRTKPSGARVYVDGVFRGVSPTSVKGLGGGKHTLTVLLTGYALFQDEAPLGEEDIALSPLSDKASASLYLGRMAQAPRGPERDEALRTWADAASAPQAVAILGRMVGGRIELTALRVDVDDGHTLAYVEKTMAEGDSLGAEGLAARLVDTDAPRVDRPVRYHQERRAVGKARQAAGTVLLAVAVGLVAQGVVFGVGARNEASTYAATPQVEVVKSQSLVQRGRAFSITADVSLGAGLLSGVVGAILAFTTWGQPEGENAAGPRPR